MTDVGDPKTLRAAFLISLSIAASPLGITSARALDWNCATKHTIDATQPVNIGLLKPVLRDYRYCGGYDADFAAKISEAKTYLQEHAAGVERPALVLDIDETSLSNWLEIEQDDFGFIPSGDCTLQSGRACGDTAWELSARAEVLAPTLDLFNTAKSLNVAIFFVTGRMYRQDLHTATIRNLKDAGYDSWQDLYMRPYSSPGASVGEYKTRTRKLIQDDLHYRIIANVGDQQSDLTGGYDDQIFKVPNPFYYIP